ncbi:MAG: DegV family protein [Eubacteriales bacterium]
MANIKFLTDSAADVPRDVLKEVGLIDVLPFPMIVDGKEFADGVDMTSKEFYDVLYSCENIPTHAQLTPFLFCEVYEHAWEEGVEHLIYVSINSKASATHQNAHQAIEMFYEKVPEAREKFIITIIDSLSYTLAYGYPLVQGAKMAKNGVEAQEIIDYITDWVKHSRILFVTFDLRFAKKSGRVSAVAAFVGEALGIKPLLTFENGQSKILGKVRGSKAVISTLMTFAEAEREKDSPYLLLRTSNEEQDTALAEACMESFGKPPEMVSYVGGVISINAGPNTIGLVYRKKR